MLACKHLSCSTAVLTTVERIFAKRLLHRSVSVRCSCVNIA